jgi:hypothetical protein
VPELELMAKFIGYGLENLDGLIGDFGADAVAGENGEIEDHG